MAAELMPEQAKELERLNLHPRERSLLERVLARYPDLTVPEVLAHLRESGM
jgi:hypothetical protein